MIFAGLAPESFNLENFAPTSVGAFLNPQETVRRFTNWQVPLTLLRSGIWFCFGWGCDCGEGKAHSGYIAVFGWWAIIVLFGVGMAAIRG